MGPTSVSAATTRMFRPHGSIPGWASPNRKGGRFRIRIIEYGKHQRRLPDFLRNPQQFIEYAIEVINRTKGLALVDGIRYQRLGDDVYYAQELFEQEELTGYLKNTLAVTKSVYQQVVFDSAGVEKSFAEELEGDDSAKVYAKLPRLVQGADPARHLQPRLGGVDRPGRRGASVLRSRDERKPLH
jgi:Endonuclease domain